MSTVFLASFTCAQEPDSSSVGKVGPAVACYPRDGTPPMAGASGGGGRQAPAHNGGTAVGGMAMANSPAAGGMINFAATGMPPAAAQAGHGMAGSPPAVAHHGSMASPLGSPNAGGGELWAIPSMPGMAAASMQPLAAAMGMPGVLGMHGAAGMVPGMGMPGPMYSGMPAYGMNPNIHHRRMQQHQFQMAQAQAQAHAQAQAQAQAQQAQAQAHAQAQAQAQAQAARDAENAQAAVAAAAQAAAQATAAEAGEAEPDGAQSNSAKADASGKARPGPSTVRSGLANSAWSKGAPKAWSQVAAGGIKPAATAASVTAASSAAAHKNAATAGARVQAASSLVPGVEVRALIPRLRELIHSAKLHTQYLSVTRKVWSGMINTDNFCYAHSMLQALMGMPMFYDLVHQLYPAYDIVEWESTPIIYMLLSLDADMLCKESSTTVAVSTARQRKAKSRGRRRGRGGVPGSAPASDGSSAGAEGAAGATARVGEAASSTAVQFEVAEAFNPEYVRDAVSLFVAKYAGDMAGSTVTHQHDAQEWLTFVLHSLHEEFLLAGGLADTSDDGDGWSEVSKGGRAAEVSRTASRDITLISQLFAGTTKSTRSGGGQASLVTLQPFWTVQLYVADHDSVRDCLASFAGSELIEGYVDKRTGRETRVTNDTSFHTLPPILIFSLKRFTYNKAGGPIKIVRPIKFEHELTIPKNLCSESLKSSLISREATTSPTSG
ncbi:ubiquitin specific protease 10 [Thecamonas trahens ATCC 50062]|uniref:ubiquitinyl hydrolase 1 n=1 Tax=Thecamonas trahens ATCC 50062 TaxID=461836 RepID=A0A0L0DHF2_THETB|nr:ubiquitin specific protease 10 [Thecamonas trahens ATCC 50062]KNC50738.1 ubiquitin specific protease 10 [Thecamonas trahens ATCC 50062]|eukprot:XP_013756704.1 ubiquitin specific protease 10 [Thecamonas trahens ATCC 50062]